MNAQVVSPIEAHKAALRPYTDMEAFRVSHDVGAMQALLDPRYKAWWSKRFGNGPAVRRGFDEGNIHPDDPCQSKGRL